MPWSDTIIRAFEKVPINPSEADFLGPYNKLLYSLFPPDTDFMVAPQHESDFPNSQDFLIGFQVTHRGQFVLFLELKRPSDLLYNSRRRAADRQVRIPLKDIGDESPFPVLYAISAFGTKLCFYSKHKGQPYIQPRVIPAHSDVEMDTAPRERWNYDLLEAEGEQKFREMVQQIKQACAAV